MLRHALALVVAVQIAPSAVSAKESDALPAAFRKAALGVWARIATDVGGRIEPETLALALATCRQDPSAMRTGTVIMPRGKYVVRADTTTRDVTAIAAAKAGETRGLANPWALATDRGYAAVAFVTRGKGAGARHFMLDDTGVYLRCGGLPKGVSRPAEPSDD